MQVTGIGLNVALQQQNKRLKTLGTRFENSIKLFEFEVDRPNLVELSEEIEKGELLVAELQHAVSIYNFKNQILFEGKEYTLAHAIRLVSVLDRTEVRWRKTFEKEDRYGSEQRSVDTKYREYTMTFAQRAAQQEKAQERAATLRSALHVANARTLELDLSPEAQVLVKT